MPTTLRRIFNSAKDNNRFASFLLPDFVCFALTRHSVRCHERCARAAKYAIGIEGVGFLLFVEYSTDYHRQ